jgi:hypothetical protein
MNFFTNSFFVFCRQVALTAVLVSAAKDKANLDRYVLVPLCGAVVTVVRSSPTTFFKGRLRGAVVRVVV